MSMVAINITVQLAHAHIAQASQHAYNTSLVIVGYGAHERAAKQLVLVRDKVCVWVMQAELAQI